MLLKFKSHSLIDLLVSPADVIVILLLILIVNVVAVLVCIETGLLRTIYATPLSIWADHIRVDH